jgi:hypothetical protein
VVLFDDVVEVFVLAQQDIDAGIGLDAIDGRRVGLSIVIFSGKSCRLMARSRKRRAAARARLAVRKKSTVSPARSTARYRYFQ